MVQPGNGQIDVITDALRKDAQIWDDEAAATGNILPKAEELRLNRIEAGLFQVIFDTYHNVIDQVISRSSEGKLRMTEIGSTLRATADAYDRIDADNAQNLRSIR